MKSIIVALLVLLPVIAVAEDSWELKKAKQDFPEYFAMVAERDVRFAKQEERDYQLSIERERYRVLLEREAQQKEQREVSIVVNNNNTAEASSFAEIRQRVKK